MKIRENEESSTLRKLNILYLISKHVSSTLDLPRILRTILTGVTFGDGFGFNRAYLFLADSSQKYLEGRLAVGPDSYQDAHRIWQHIKQINCSLEDFLNHDSCQKGYSSELDRQIKYIKIGLDSGKLAAQAYHKNKVINVDIDQPGFQGKVEPQLLSFIDYGKFCIIPLASFNRRLGLMIVDNKYNRREITAEDISFLGMLSQQAALAIENANAYHDLKHIVNRLVKVNEKIRYLKEYNENILQNIPIGICVLDTEFNINACNFSFCRMLSATRQQLLGRPVAAANLKIRGRNIKRLLKKVIKADKNRTLSRVEADLGHGSKICNLNLSILKDSQSQTEGIIIIMDDITERVHLEETLEGLKKLAQLGEFAAHVAHEIRNPLAAIGGYARRLRKDHFKGAKTDTESMDIIIQEVERLENIVNQTLQYSHSGKKEELKVISLGHILAQCVQITGAYARDRKLEIDVSSGLPPGQELWVKGSPEKLKQAFINLIKNSIEASYSGEKISIQVGSKAGWAEVRIRNRGSIIEKGDIDKIFLPFYSTKKEGTGLGLAITKTLITEHKGEIDVYSKKDNTIFTIKLPEAGGKHENNTDSGR